MSWVIAKIDQSPCTFGEISIGEVFLNGPATVGLQISHSWMRVNPRTNGWDVVEHRNTPVPQARSHGRELNDLRDHIDGHCRFYRVLLTWRD